MKRILIKYITAAVLGLPLIFATPGCEKIKDFGDINNNPDLTTTPITSALLTNVLAGIGGYAASARAGLYCQYFSETQYTETSLYAIPQLEFSGNYSGALYDLENIIINNTDAITKDKVLSNGSNANQIAVARILQAYIFWWITDNWGDIPYSGALKGDRPNYDKQQDVYTDLFKELTQAVAQFDGGATVKGDILFSGDITRWKKFANSIRLVMAVRISKADAAKGATEAAAAVAASGGIITTNADNVIIAYPGGAFKNPWFNLYDGRLDFAMSDVADNILTTPGDNRLAVFGSSNIGFPYGLTRPLAVAFGNSNPNWALILNSSNRQSNSPAALMNASTVLLAYAEAKQRGWIGTGPTAATLYADAIKASWEQWGVYNLANYNSYMTHANVSYGAGVELRRIAEQRWLAAYPNGSQGWFEWRRTGYPTLVPTIHATNVGGQIPRRYVYGLAEYSLNEVGVTAAVANLTGGDVMSSRVWWDKP